MACTGEPRFAMHSLISYLAATLPRSWRMFMAIARIMVPVMIIVRLAQQSGLVHALGEWLSPAMALLNLPAEAAIIWATAILTGVYGGLASLASLAGTLDITSAQLSALSAMMLIAHNIPVEQSIVRKAGASFMLTTLLRIGTGALYGALVAWTCHLGGWMAEPVNLDWLRGSEYIAETGAGALWAWVQSTAISLMLTYGVLLGLVFTLDALERLGITQRITRAITPVLRLSGLNTQAAPVTTVGVLLGLSYGGALIIEEADRLGFSARTRLLALSWLSLSHSLIEDTLLFLALGANGWIILAGRLALTLAIIALMARWTLGMDAVPAAAAASAAGSCEAQARR